MAATGWLTPKPPMDLKKASVCITGGSDGIGLGLAKEFQRAGSTVIVTGRRADALQKAKDNVPGLHTFQGDVGKIGDRQKLAEWLQQNFPDLKIFVNNAGIVRKVTAPKETDDWAERQAEIAINLEAPVHFVHLLTPAFLKQPEAAFISTTSGLAYCASPESPMSINIDNKPIANLQVQESVPLLMPTVQVLEVCADGATKAGLHSWIVASRWAYLKTNIRLVEIIPPLVKTKMAGGFGEELDEFCRSVFQRFASGELEIGFGTSEKRRLGSREVLDEYCYDLADKIKPPQF